MLKQTFSMLATILHLRPPQIQHSSEAARCLKNYAPNLTFLGWSQMFEKLAPDFKHLRTISKLCQCATLISRFLEDSQMFEKLRLNFEKLSAALESFHGAAQFEKTLAGPKILGKSTSKKHPKTSDLALKKSKVLFGKSDLRFMPFLVEQPLLKVWTSFFGKIKSFFLAQNFDLRFRLFQNNHLESKLRLPILPENKVSGSVKTLTFDLAFFKSTILFEKPHLRFQGFRYEKHHVFSYEF